MSKNPFHVSKNCPSFFCHESLREGLSDPEFDLNPNESDRNILVFEKMSFFEPPMIRKVKVEKESDLCSKESSLEVSVQSIDDSKGFLFARERLKSRRGVSVPFKKSTCEPLSSSSLSHSPLTLFESWGITSDLLPNSRAFDVVSSSQANGLKNSTFLLLQGPLEGTLLRLLPTASLFAEFPSRIFRIFRTPPKRFEKETRGPGVMCRRYIFGDLKRLRRVLIKKCFRFQL